MEIRCLAYVRIVVVLALVPHFGEIDGVETGRSDRFRAGLIRCGAPVGRDDPIARLPMRFSSAAVVLVVSTSGSLQAAEDLRPYFSLKQDFPETGSNIKRSVMTGSVLPDRNAYDFGSQTSSTNTASSGTSCWARLAAALVAANSSTVTVPSNREPAGTPRFLKVFVTPFARARTRVSCSEAASCSTTA